MRSQIAPKILYDRQQLIEIERFREMNLIARGKDAVAVLFGGVSCIRDRLDGMVSLTLITPELRYQLKTIHGRHANVADQNVKIVGA